MRNAFKKLSAAVLTCLSLLVVAPTAGQAQERPMIGELRFFAGDYAPQGWMKCEGQILSIADYDALFSLVGTIYGGDGRTTFALPDMRGRVPLHAGEGPGLRPVRLGEKGGGHAAAPLASESGRDVSAVAMTCIIAVEGNYPSRS